MGKAEGMVLGEGMLLLGFSSVPWNGVPAGGMLLLQSDPGLLRMPQNLVSPVSCRPCGDSCSCPLSPTLQHPSMMLRHPIPPPNPSPPHFGGADPSLCPLAPRSPPWDAATGSQDLDSITFFSFSLIEGYISIVMDAETQKR